MLSIACAHEVGNGSLQLMSGMNEEKCSASLNFSYVLSSRSRPHGQVCGINSIQGILLTVQVQGLRT